MEASSANPWNRFTNWLEKPSEALHHLSNRQLNQSPWDATAPAKALNPILNVSLTVVHGAKTLERTAKTGYYLLTSLGTSLATVFTLGTKKEINQQCSKQWIGLGLNLYASLLSLGFTLGNIGVGVQGLFAIKKATKNELWLLKQQNAMDRELPEAKKLFCGNLIRTE